VREACSFFRVYVPSRVAPTIQDLYDAQAGKYIVTVPDMGVFNGGEAESSCADGYMACKAVVDDFGNLRRVP
jgi:hypothetical protein